MQPIQATLPLLRKAWHFPNAHLFFWIALGWLLGGTVIPALAECEVMLAWDESQGASLYRLYVREENQVYEEPLWEGSERECTVAALQESTSYYFVVRAVNVNGHESGNSNEVRFNSDSDSGGGGGGGGCFLDSFLR